MIYVTIEIYTHRIRRTTIQRGNFMDSQSVNRKVLALLLLGALTVILFLYFFVDLSETIKTVSSANPYLCTVALLFVVAGIFFYAVTWEIMLHTISKRLGLWKAFQYVCTSIFMSIVIPGGTLSEETTRTYLTMKNSNNNAGSVIASIISHRAIDIIPFLGGACLSFLFMIKNREFLGYAIYVISFVILLIILALSPILYLAIRPEKTEKILDAIFRLVARFYKKPEKLLNWKEIAAEELKLFHEGIDHLRNKPFTLSFAFFFTILSYTCDIIAPMLVFRALGTDVPYTIIITVYTITVALLTIPVGIPGMTGPAEIAMITIYSAAGVSPATAAAATIILRGMNLWFETALGGVMAYRVGLKTLNKTS